MTGTPPVVVKTPNFVYIQGPAVNTVPGVPGSTPRFICVWIEDAVPDRFHLEDRPPPPPIGPSLPPPPPPYTSGGPNVGCPGPAAPLPPNPGYEVAAGAITVF